MTRRFTKGPEKMAFQNRTVDRRNGSEEGGGQLELARSMQLKLHIPLFDTEHNIAHTTFPIEGHFPLIVVPKRKRKGDESTAKFFGNSCIHLSVLPQVFNPVGNFEKGKSNFYKKFYALCTCIELALILATYRGGEGGRGQED